MISILERINLYGEREDYRKVEGVLYSGGPGANPEEYEEELFTQRAWQGVGG